MRIRPESTTDFEAVHHVNQLAFGSELEGRIVARIREEASPVISLVADDDGLVGHILFSPVSRGERDSSIIMALGPMAVMPARQRQGIGSALVIAGLDACRDAGVGGVVLIGHPGFYPRFGFRPGSEFGLRSEFEVSDEAFMAMELTEHSLRTGTGMIHFHPAFFAV